MRLLIAAMSLAAAGAAHAATAEITVQGVRNDHGHVRVALCTMAEFLHPLCRFHAQAAAHPGAVTLVINDVPPGTYAVQAFHDENDNATIDRNFFGMPTEGMGFSNNAPMHFGPPAFAAAAVTISNSPVTLTFPLQYY